MQAYVVMALCRDSRLIVGAQLLKERSWACMQAFVDPLPQALEYCSDAWMMNTSLLWPDGNTHIVGEGKDQTYPIEGINADLRTYLGRLNRKVAVSPGALRLS